MNILRERGLTLADLLPDGKFDEICSAGAGRTYSDGQLILERGDTWQGVSIVNSGQVVAGNTGEDGSFLASAILRPGDCFGEFTAFLGLARSHSLWSQGASRITHIKRERFVALFDSDSSIARALFKLSLLRSYEMLDFLDAQRRLSLPMRIARLLLTAVDADPAPVTVECRQEDLAFMLGVSRVSIGKALKRLEKDGLINLSYGQITLNDVSGLKDRIASEDQFLPLPLRKVSSSPATGALRELQFEPPAS